MIFTKQEKGQPLDYQEADNNYIELRDVIAFVLTQTSEANILDQDVDDLVIGINNLQNNYLKKSNNLSDLNSFTISRNNMDLYSKLQADNNFLDVFSGLTNIQDANTVRNNLEIGTNALRDVNITRSNQFPEPIDGENGDIWHDWGITTSTPGF